MGKARLAGRALVGGVWFSVSGWTKWREMGAVTDVGLFALLFSARACFCNLVQA